MTQNTFCKSPQSLTRRGISPSVAAATERRGEGLLPPSQSSVLSPQHLFLPLLVIFSLTFLSGCAAGLLGTDMGGTEHAMPARFTPPKEPTLILVEADRMSGSGDPDCRRLAQFIGHEFDENKVAPLVNDDSINNIRQNDPKGYAHMSIAALGRAAGAKQVVYISIVNYGMDTPIGSDHVKWSASVQVKVVDSQTGESRWPRELTDGEPLSAETEYRQAEDAAGAGGVRDNLNQMLAEKIGKLFHPWTRTHDDASDYEN